MEYPLIILPRPASSSRSERSPFYETKREWDHKTQVERLTPKFQHLLNALEKRKIEIQTAAMGIEPEMTLVIKIKGSLDNFKNTVKNINGLKWLTEYEQDEDETEPDEDVADGTENRKFKLFFLFTNESALKELLRLWGKYTANPDKKFAKIFPRGLTQLGKLFEMIEDIRYWDVNDRLEETGILEFWNEDLREFGAERLTLEIELWSTGLNIFANRAEKQVTERVEELNGRVLKKCRITEIGYHGMLAELPRESVRRILETRDVELVKCEKIMFFRPTGQMADRTPVENLQETKPSDAPAPSNLPSNPPVAALLDGYPLEKHKFLDNRLIVDDPEEWGVNYPAQSRIHGTAMASIIIHGDLNALSDPITSKLYVRPIMKPVGFENEDEAIPGNVLDVDLIHGAVKRLFDSTENTVPKTIKVINLSIGDPNRPFHFSMSPLARLLDWLSFKYNVLFIVSAGNRGDEIKLEKTVEEWDKLNPTEKEFEILKALCNQKHQRRIFSPAESINALTVGALDSSSTNKPPRTGSYFYPFAGEAPSVISPFGNGYNRSTKPDLLYSGGRKPLATPMKKKELAVFELAGDSPDSGIKTAGVSAAGTLNDVAVSCGTSNSTAFITHFAIMIHDSLTDLFSENNRVEDLKKYMTPLLKAMIVHGCDKKDITDYLERLIKTGGAPEKSLKKAIRKWVGFGVPDFSNVFGCTPQRVTMIGYGELEGENAHIFKMPLPHAICNKAIGRKLVVTLAWISPVSHTTQVYRMVDLWIELEDKGFFVESSTRKRWPTTKGTVQQVIFSEDTAFVAPTGNENNTRNEIGFKVNCRQMSAGNEKKKKFTVSYGLIVSLELSPPLEEEIDLYHEIKSLIAARAVT